MLTIDEAVHKLRGDPQYAELVHTAYLDRNVSAAGTRFLQSEEFRAVQTMLGDRLRNGVVIDVGAGSGIASYAFAHSGARHVYAVEPDASEEVGRGAIERIRANQPISIIAAFGDAIPLETACADIVYVRQVLHHVLNLPETLTELARLLKPGGIFLACREHVVDNAQQLADFLAQHPIHQLTGGENAYPLAAYLSAIQKSGLVLKRCIEPWESVINAYPFAKTPAELQRYPVTKLHERFGAVGGLLAQIPGIQALTWRWIKRPYAGRMYSFLAVKPG